VSQYGERDRERERENAAVRQPYRKNANHACVTRRVDSAGENSSIVRGRHKPAFFMSCSVVAVVVDANIYSARPLTLDDT